MIILTLKQKIKSMGNAFYLKIFQIYLKDNLNIYKNNKMMVY